jgi:hypothetical protein
MSLGRLPAALLLSTLIACSGGGPAQPDPQGPVLPSASLGQSTVGAPFQRSLAASGGAAPLSYSAQGLPSGIVLDAQTGALSGSPASAGSFDIDATVTDAAGRSDQKRYPLLVLEAPRFVTTSLPPANVNAAYAARIEATGGRAPLAYAISGGAAPPGLVIDGSGTLSGIPSAAGTYAFELSVTDAHGSVTRAQFTLVVRPPPPTIVTTELPSGTVSRAYHFAVVASGGALPHSWSTSSGALPAGLALSTAGELTGTPSSAGTAYFTLEVRDAQGQSAQQAFTLSVADALSITTASSPDGYTGAPYLQTLAATGGRPPYRWALANGSLPAGISLDTSGRLGGTPSASGNSSFTVSVSDADDLSATRMLSVTVYAPPALSAVPAQSAYVSDAIDLPLNVTGGKAPYAFSGSGSLPPGLSLDSSTGRLQGTLTSPGTFSFNVSAADANGRTSTLTVSFTVHSLPSITTTALPAGNTGQPYSAQLTASGGQGSRSWSHTGTLPPGLSLSSSGALGGTPTTAGTYSFTARVTDAHSRTDSRTLTLVIQGPPTITTTEFVDGYLASDYSATLTASGGLAPLSWSYNGSLPPGLSLSSSGVLSGTPPASGVFTFTARVSDALGRSDSRTLTLVVYRPPSIDQTPNSEIYISEPYSSSFSATDGKAPYTFSVASGALPAGLSLASNGTVSGTATTAGRADLEVRVRDANGRSATQVLSLHVYALPTLDTALPEARLGEFYSHFLSVSGGRPPYIFFVEAGVLPAGITLDWDGWLTGTPTGSGGSFLVRVYDSNSRTDARPLTLNVYAPPRITTPSVPAATLNAPYTFTFGYTGGRGTLFWGSSGELPPGLTFTSDGSITGTPIALGTWSFTVTLSDSEGEMDSREFSLTVRAPAPDGGFPDGGFPDGGFPDGGSPPDGGSLFVVGHWNIEWFGSNTEGPPRSTSPGGPLDDLQIANARSVLADAGVHLWGLAEMVDTADFQILKTQLPGYDGFLSNDPRVVLGSDYYSTQEQKLGVLYDSRLTFRDAGLILTESDFDFAGRPPMRVDFATPIHGADSLLTVIVVHMKANDDRSSYDRRQRAGAALKNYLQNYLPSDRVLVVGDWNDDVDVSITHESGTPLPSPYDNFVYDPNNYAFVTRPLSLAGERSTVGFPDMVDHTLVSNELQADYVQSSAYVLRPDWIPDYDGTTSDHYPVISHYDFSPSSTPATLTLTGPNGGTYAGGSQVVITWEASPNIGPVELEYSLDYGAWWTPLVTVPNAAVGSYTWTVPNVDSTGVLVRIRSTQPVLQDVSDTPLVFVYTPPPYRVFINEYLANEPSGPLPDGGYGALTDHEFVELVNAGPQAADLSQWTLWDSNGQLPRHVFAPGTVLESGKAWVVYGGASAFPPGTPSTEAASSGRLGLNNTTDRIYLVNPLNAIVSDQSYSNPPESESFNQVLDGNPDSPYFIRHSEFNPALLSSPGKRADGTPF